MGDVIRLSLLKGDRTADVRHVSGPAVDDAAKRTWLASSDPSSFHGSIHPILVVDSKGQILDANDAALLLLDQEPATLFSMSISDIVIHLDDVIMDLIFKVAPLGRRIIIDALCSRSDGSWVPCEVVVNHVAQDSEGRWLVHLLLNETNKARQHDDAVGNTEAKLARAERLEMAGIVAGQIAHDFNNLLTPMLAYPELIRHEVKGNSTVGEYIDIIEKTAGDMSRLTQQLLSLARRGRLGSEVFCVNDVIGQVVNLMQSVVPPGITIELNLADNLLNATGGRDQMRRVIENLFQNAVDAMGASGVLGIKTENVYLDTPVGTYSAVTMGEYVKITLTDTGGGIPENIRDKIFDPFFTTKRSSKQRGSGLGLSIVHGIVRDHRGYIDVESVPGTGSTFFVYIPISRNVPQKESVGDLPRGTESVLVVDDDAPQFQVLSNLLDVLGYKVSGATSGEECLDLVKNKGRRYDLIVLDMVMDRGIDGLATFLEVRKLVPQQRVILISGYAKAARRIAKAQELGAGIYLRKPLTIDRVARAVRDELDHGPKGDVQPIAKANRRILIVDDEQMIRKLFGMIVLSEFPDAVIDQAANGNEALTAFQEGHHDLIVMDLQMPVMDGREAFVGIQRICEKNKWTVPRVIFCTGFTLSESMAEIVKESTVHCLLRKPVKADTLIEAVRQRLRY